MEENEIKKFCWKFVRIFFFFFICYQNIHYWTISFVSCFILILFIFRFESNLIVLYCVDWSFAQNFANCDFYKELTPNVVYSFTSPNYNKPYAPGTFCRYTGTTIDLTYFLIHKKFQNCYSFAAEDLVWSFIWQFN